MLLSWGLKHCWHSLIRDRWTAACSFLLVSLEEELIGPLSDLCIKVWGEKLALTHFCWNHGSGRGQVSNDILMESVGYWQKSVFFSLRPLFLNFFVQEEWIFPATLFIYFFFWPSWQLQLGGFWGAMSDIYGWKKDSPVNATSQVLRTLVSHQTFPPFRVFPHLIILLCSRIFTYKRKNLGDVGLLHITRTEVSPLNDNMTFFFFFLVIIVTSILVHRYIG